MFRFLLFLASLGRILRFVLGQVFSLLLLGIPIFWALHQRKRLKALALAQGWRYKPKERLREFGELHKEVEGVCMEVWAGDSFGAKLFANFTTFKHMDLKSRRPSQRPEKKMRDFDTGHSDFDAMFGTRRGRDKTIQDLLDHPETMQAVVDLRRRWVFAISDMSIGSHYLLLYMNYGTPFAYYLPPRVLEKLTREVAHVGKLLDEALGHRGVKINS